MAGLCHSHAVTLLSSLKKKKNLLWQPSHTLLLLLFPLIQLHTTHDYVSKQSDPSGTTAKISPMGAGGPSKFKTAANRQMVLKLNNVSACILCHPVSPGRHVPKSENITSERDRPRSTEMELTPTFSSMRCLASSICWGTPLIVNIRTPGSVFGGGFLWSSTWAPDCWFILLMFSPPEEKKTKTEGILSIFFIKA